MSISIKNLTAGFGALCVVGVGGTGVFLMTSGEGDETPLFDTRITHAPEDRLEEICLRAPLPYFEGAQARCYSRTEFAGLYDLDVLDNSGQSVAVTLTHPNDLAVPDADCRTCRDFIKLSWESWFPMTSRAQRRNAYFVRACGILEALSKAGLPSETFFDGDALNERDIAALLNDTMFGFGEASLAPVDESLVLKSETGEWRVESEGMLVTVQELASANFDKDGAAEILVYVEIGPTDGAVRVSEVGLVDKDSPDARAQFKLRTNEV